MVLIHGLHRWGALSGGDVEGAEFPGAAGISDAG